MDEARTALARLAAMTKGDASMTDDDDSPRGYASPPCLAHEIDPTYFDPLAVDATQARDVARWRKAERARLLAERAALSVAVRQAAAERDRTPSGPLIRGAVRAVRGPDDFGLVADQGGTEPAALAGRSCSRAARGGVAGRGDTAAPHWCSGPGRRIARWCRASGRSRFLPKGRR